MYVKGGKGRLWAAFSFMVNKVARLQQGNLMIGAQADERRPIVTNGLVAHYPLDGSLNNYQFSPVGLRVLYQSSSNTAGGYTFTQWLSSNGAIVTQSTDLTTVTVATAQTYDLIVADFYVWAVSSAIMSQLKTFVDAGVSCLAMGNDTTTNTFVSSVNTTSTIHATHDVWIADSYPTYTSSVKYAGVGSSDVYGGISALQNGARALYYRSDHTDLIMGYWYEGLTGAVLYFDQEGLASLPEFAQNMVLFAASRSNASITNTNTAWDSSGLVISRTSTNVVYDNPTDPSTWRNRRGGYKLLENYQLPNAPGDQPPAGVKGYYMDNTSSADTWSGNAYSYTNIYSSTPANGTIITYSVYCYVSPDCNCDWVRISSEQSATGQSLYDMTKVGTWQRLTATVTVNTATGNGSTPIYLYFTKSGNTTFATAGMTGYVVFAAPQVELLAFPTAFVNGTRGDSTFKIQNGMGTVTTWTLRFDYYHSSLSSFGSNMVFASSYDGSVTGNWFGLSAGTNNISSFNGPASPPNQWNSAIFTYDGTTTTFYLNGVQSGTFTGKFFFTQSTGGMISFSSMIGWNVNTFLASHKIRNYSVWNRVLTAAEIQKIAKPSFSLKKDGTIATSSVRERPNNITYSSFYFPLTIDGSDVTGKIVPSTDSNTVYTKDGLYLDKGTTNQVPNPSGKNGIAIASEAWDVNLHRDALSVSSWSDGYNGGVTDPQIGYHAKWVNEGLDGGPCMKFMDLNSQFTYTAGGAMTHRWLGVSSSSIGTGTSLGWASGTSVTISWAQKTDTPTKGASVGIYHTLTSTGGMSFGPTNQMIASKKTNVWERVSYTFTVDSDWNLSNANYIYVYGYMGPEGTLWVDDLQVEVGTYPTGFTNGTRGASLLKYPLNFTPNMSFSFWHKLNNDLASITTQNTSPNLFEVGDYYANSSFTLWYWGGNKLYVYARQDGATGWTIGGVPLSGTFDQTYWNKWHNYTIVFNGSGSAITGVTVYIDGTARYTNSALTITSWSGSFFGFGSYNGMQPNAIYRDMVYTPTALSSTDALNLYKNQMRAYKDNRMQVQSRLMEGQVLS